MSLNFLSMSLINLAIFFLSASAKVITSLASCAVASSRGSVNKFFTLSNFRVNLFNKGALGASDNFFQSPTLGIPNFSLKAPV